MGGGNPIKRFEKGVLRPFKRTLIGAGTGFLAGGPIGALAGTYVGLKGDERQAEKKAFGEAQAEAEAAAKQAEFEASKRAGLERLAQKRKKGFGASMIVNPVLGSTGTLGN